MEAINKKIESFRLELKNDLSKIKYYSFEGGDKPLLRLLDEKTSLFVEQEVDCIANGFIYVKNVGTDLDCLWLDDLCLIVDAIPTNFKI